jgi:FixJ family two-component response regulator
MSGYLNLESSGAGKFDLVRGRLDFSKIVSRGDDARIGSMPNERADRPIVLIVDDDAAMRAGITDLLRSVNIEACGYESTADLLAIGIPDRPCCLVLDVRLPGMSGLEFQDNISELNVRCPIIFITGFADVPMSVRAMKAGAIDFLAKPFRDQELLDAVGSAIRTDIARRQNDREVTELRDLAAHLSPREAEVVSAVGRGLLNKQIAFELNIAEITVKMHRSSAFRKLKAKSTVDLVRKAELLNLIKR